jgi:hypothetical protein
LPAKVGSTLTAATRSWKPKGVKLTYQWYRAGKAVKGATSQTYGVTAADLDSRLKVQVKGSKHGYHSVTKTSAQTSAVPAGNLASSVPTISGTASLGATLTAEVGSWGPAPVSFSYQWYQDGAAIGGTNSSTYVIRTDDVGKRLSVGVTGNKVGYSSVQRRSAETAAVVSPASGKVMARTQRMSDATLRSTQNGWYEVGARLTLVCYRHGQAVKGYFSGSFSTGLDDLWYKVSDGFFVADVDLETGTTNPVVGACADQGSSVDRFVTANMGKSLANAQGTYQGECVSLVSQYLLQVYGVTTNAWGNAIDYQSGRSGGNHMAANGFAWHTDTNFANGDIIVWGLGQYTSSYGHIAVWYNGKIFDQNYAGRRTAGLDPYFPYGYLGYWRK